MEEKHTFDSHMVTDPGSIQAQTYLASEMLVQHMTNNFNWSLKSMFELAWDVLL